MTKQLFEHKRREALQKALTKAEHDVTTRTGRNRQANAQKRIEMICKHMEDNNNNFWNAENTRAYELIYENYPNEWEVSPY